MATIANLNILLTLEDKANEGLEKSKRNLQGWGKSLQNIGAGLTAGLTAPILGGAAAAVKMASDQQEAISAVTEVYGSAASEVLAYGDAAATAMGLSKSEYLSAAAVLGVYADAAGLTGSAAAEFAQDNMQLAADLGSFYNDSTENVTAALQAAYRGEFDSLDKYGIMLNQNTLEQYALAEGIWDGNGAMTTQQRILATNAYMQGKAGAAAGDFARTSDNLANRQKILMAQLKNVAAQLGTMLIPYVTKAVKAFQSLITGFQSLSPSMQKVIVLVALIVAAIGPFLLVLGTILTMLPAIGAALAVLTGPIGLVIAAIALLTMAYIGNWWGFRDAVNGIASAVADAVTAFLELEIVKSAIGAVVTAVTGLATRVIGAFDKIGSAILSGNWRAALAGIGDLLAAPAKAVGDFLRNFETGFAGIDRVLTLVGSQITAFGRLIQEIFQGDFNGAFEVLKGIVGRVPQIFQAAFDAIPWSQIGDAISSGFDALPGLIGDLSGVLKEKGIDLLVGVLTGLNETMPTITAWLGLLGEIALAAVGSLLTTLYNSGVELLDGVRDGLNGNVGTVVGWMQSLPGIIVGALGYLGGTLYSAGADLIGGLIGGIESMIGFLKDKLTSITNLIPDWKGPASRDARLLWNNGTLIMSGLIGGIEAQVPMLERTLEDITVGMDRNLDANLIASGARASLAARNVQGMQDARYGSNSVYRNNYGTIIQEAPSYPEDALDGYAIARGRR